MVEIIDVNAKAEDAVPTVFFTVSIMTDKGPKHILVKASSALEALGKTQEIEKAPVVGVHITEYFKYLDVTETVNNERIQEVPDSKETEIPKETIIEEGGGTGS